MPAWTGMNRRPCEKRLCTMSTAQHRLVRIDCEGQEKSRGWRAVAHGQRMQQNSTTGGRAVRTEISAADAHTIRLSTAVRPSCSSLTIPACCGLLWREAAGRMCGWADQQCSRESDICQPNSNFGSNNCPCIHCRALMWLRGSVASTEARMCEGSELGRDASARSAMGRPAQQRIVVAGHDASDRMRVREGHTAA